MKNYAVEVSNRHLASRLAEPKNEIGVFKEKLAKVPLCMVYYTKAWLSLYLFYYDLIQSRYNTTKPLRA